MMNAPTNTPFPQLISKPIFYSIGVSIVFFILILFFIVYDVQFTLYKSKESMIRTTLIVLFSSLLFFTACVLFVPYLKDFKIFLFQIQHVMYLILYTIFTILFYVLMPSQILNTYSTPIHTIILALGAFCLYVSTNTSLYSNVNYERIKMIIIFVCLITILSILYHYNAGNMTTILLLVASVFALIYTILLITLPNTTSTFYFSSFEGYGTLLFVVFLITMFGILYSKQDQLFQNKEKMASIILFMFIISVLWSMLIGIHLFSRSGTILFNTRFIQSGIFAMFSLVLSGLFIYWISSSLETLSGKTSIVSFTLNIALVTMILALIYKTLNIQFAQGNAKSNALVGLIGSVIFYIPCMVNIAFNQFTQFTSNEIKNHSQTNVWMLLISILLLVSYYYSHLFVHQINTLGGRQLINQPVPLHQTVTLGNYKTLNQTDNFRYQYALSCWVFIDAAPPNTNSRYTQFTSILNYGNKPNILYHSKNNTLRIIMYQKELEPTSENTDTMEFDDEGNRIIYETTQFPLQKWNNLILNYNGGTLDIFLNGKLVKSSIQVSPYLEYDNLVVGTDLGILGGICNVLYFKKPLDTFSIGYLYNTVKHLSPPVMNDSKDTVVKQN